MRNLRRWIKFLLIVLVLFGLCLDYRFITIDQYGFKTCFNKYTFAPGSVSDQEIDTVTQHAKVVYTYRIFGYYCLAVETDMYGIIISYDKIEKDENGNVIDVDSSAAAFIYTLLGIRFQAKNIIPWYLYLIAIFLIILFPKIKRKTISTEPNRSQINTPPNYQQIETPTFTLIETPECAQECAAVAKPEPNAQCTPITKNKFDIAFKIIMPILIATIIGLAAWIADMVINLYL